MASNFFTATGLTLLVLATPALAADPSQTIIPLCPSLKIVTAVSQTGGDYESIKRVVAVSGKGIRVHYSSESMIDDPFSDTPPQLKSTHVMRKILPKDQERAKFYLAVFSEKLPESIPGSTALGPSIAIYKALKESGKSEISLVTILIETATSAELVNPDSPFYWSKAPSVYTLEWTDKKPIFMPVLVNGKKQNLPALKINGTFSSEKAEFFVLDDPKNPLILKFRLGIGYNDSMRNMIINDPVLMAQLEADPTLKAATMKSVAAEERDLLQVTQISYDCSGKGGLGSLSGTGKIPDAEGGFEGDLGFFDSIADLFDSEGNEEAVDGGASDGSKAGDGKGNGMGLGELGMLAEGEKAKAMEAALAEGEKVDIYDIFFSFNSAEIRPESDDILLLISSLLQKHPDWKLAIGGHTDSIASDSFNLDLSKRRALAVKEALVSRYKIEAGRLSTQGYGESSPRDTNDTLEGRANNRRVELMRIPG